jgi:hypothetical protein
LCLSQAPQLCQRQTEFSACNSKAAIQISTCSTEVSGPVSSALYGCLCKQNQAMLDCYDLCLDDPQLVMQRDSQLQNVNAACAVKVDSTTEKSATATKSATESTAKPKPTTTSSATRLQEPESESTTSIGDKPKTGNAGGRTISSVPARTQPAGIVLDSGERASVAGMLLVLLALI